MKLNISIAFTTSAILLLANNAHAAGIPVFDAVQAMNYAQTFTNDASKIQALKTQIDQLNTQIKMVSGSRGMGSLAQLHAAKMIADSWGTILQQINTNTGNYGQLVNQINAANSVLTAADLQRMSPAQQNILQRTRNLGAMQKAMSEIATQVAGQQLTEITTLTGKIDSATDPKAIADLTAALDAKKLELDNTQTRLNAMQQQVDAERRLIDQQATELEIQRAGTTSTVAVHIR